MKPLSVTFIDNVCDPAHPGRSGHSDIIWEVGRQLLSVGHHVNIAADYTAPPPYTHERLRLLKFGPRPFDRRNGLGKMVHAYRAWRRAAGVPTDLFFTTDAFSAGITALCSKRVPVVFLTPANIYQRQASGYRLDPMAELCYRAVSHVAARRTAHIIATSRDLGGWWRKTGATDPKLSVIPLGLEADLFRVPQRPLPDPARGPLKLLYVARFEGDNNPHLLVELARHLRAEGVAFRLSAVGSGTQLGGVKAAAAAAGFEGVLDFRGHVPYRELPDLYAAHDVFVFMREAGGPPRVVVQALASGLGVVAFNSSGLEDYLVSGESGFLVPNGDVAELARTVARLGRDRARLGAVQSAAAARTRDFDWQVVTARYLALFNTLLARNPADGAATGAGAAPGTPPYAPPYAPSYTASYTAESGRHG